MGFLRPFCEGTFQSAFKSPFKSAFLKGPFRTPMSVLAFKGPFGKALLKALRAPSVVAHVRFTRALWADATPAFGYRWV